MKVRMYRNYDKFPYESDHHGNFNGRMIFTFFRPIAGHSIVYWSNFRKGTTHYRWKSTNTTADGRWN